MRGLATKKKIRIVGHVIVVLGYLLSSLFVQYHLPITFLNGCVCQHAVLLGILPQDCDDSVSPSDLTRGGSCASIVTITSNVHLTSHQRSLWKHMILHCRNVSKRTALMSCCPWSYLLTCINPKFCRQCMVLKNKKIVVHVYNEVVTIELTDVWHLLVVS
jgi:hypothetical protein